MLRYIVNLDIEFLLLNLIIKFDREKCILYYDNRVYLNFWNV